VTVAECCFDTKGYGAQIDVAAVDDVPEAWRVDATLFSESASRVVVSVAPEHLELVLARAKEAGVPAAHVGEVAADRLVMRVSGHTVLDVPVALVEQAWKTGLERYFVRG
jgi:phosphoribosylformylglycinamidine synthase